MKIGNMSLTHIQFNWKLGDYYQKEVIEIAIVFLLRNQDVCRNDEICLIYYIIVLH